MFMSKVQVNAETALATLLDLSNVLKKTIVVSAAAVLSRLPNDLKANAAAAVAHLDEIGRKLDGLRNDVHRASAASFAANPNRQILEIDGELFAEKVGIVDQAIGGYRNALFDVIESEQRDGLEVFCSRVGALGRAIQEVVGLLTNKETPESTFHFDRFFLDTMAELSKSDWSTPNQGEP
jgi:hypothetical protein